MLLKLSNTIIFPSSIIQGKIFKTGDNIDTDQIIPAKYLNLVPTIKKEYKSLGSYALSGLPNNYKIRYIKEGSFITKFPIIITGKNFGCGSSREHAVISLKACGCKIIIASSYARIFYRNCISTGGIYPFEADTMEILKNVITGDNAELDVKKEIFKINNKIFDINCPSDIQSIIETGGIFEYARKIGIINNN